MNLLKTKTKHQMASFCGMLAVVVGWLFAGVSDLDAANSGYVFVSSEKDNIVTVIDSRTYTEIKKIKVADRPRHMAFGSDRAKIYVACGDGESIDIIDVVTLEVVDQIEAIDDPEAFDFSADGSLMYISLEDQGALGIIDIATKQMIASIEVGAEPEGVMTSVDGKFVFVTSEVANAVHIIDTTTQQMVDTIIVGTRPRRFAMPPASDQLWVTNELSGSVSIIDMRSRAVVKSITFQPKGFRKEDITPVGIALTDGGETAYIALGRANHVAVVDVASLKVRAYILVGERAWNITLTRDESKLLVTNGLSDDISIIDTSKNKVIKSIPVGRVPYMALIDD